MGLEPPEVSSYLPGDAVAVKYLTPLHVKVVPMPRARVQRGSAGISP